MQFDQLKRREFMTLLGGATVAWPAVARAQQPTMPVIGVLDPRSSDAVVDRLRALRQGLRGTGYVEGENVAIVYRWAENQIDRLPALATDLIQRRVNVILAVAPPAALAAQAAGTTIPIVFVVAQEPVKLGLVASLSRPGGHLTGVNFLNAELDAKRLELLHALVPGAVRVDVLVNPADVANTESTLRQVEPAGRAMGLQIQVLNASTSREIDTAFSSFARERPDALFVGQAPFLASRRIQLITQAAHHRVPASYPGREYAEVGGLMTYGSDVADAFREAGIYVGRILKGAKSAELPVVQSNKIDLVINHQTARVLGLTVPPSLLATADEVIE
jgi:putative tryptophan/tyrosine transport system substrate-binding protein